MSTNKTPNYQLHSWTSTDHFRFHEVNENFDLLDAALKAEAQTAARGRSALSAQMAGKGELVVGSYTGNGAAMQEIIVGHKIKAILIETTKGERPDHGSLYAYGGLHLPNVPLYYKTCEIDNDRFRVFCSGAGTTYDPNPTRLNDPDMQYVYLAWVGA